MKILEIIGEINGGGVGAVVYNYLAHMDRSSLNIDVLIFVGREKPLKSEIEKYKKIGCRILLIKHRNIGYIRHFVELRRILKNEGYDIVHCHLGEWSAPYLFFAKINGVCKRIAHVHISREEYSGYKKIIMKLFKKSLFYVANQIVSCGEEAKQHFGITTGDLIILRNAIDINSFLFSEKVRTTVRNELSIPDNMFVVGSVGRFTYQKNQAFILEIAKMMEDYNDIAFVLVGDGVDFPRIQERAKNCKIPIFLLGFRSDVDKILNAFDVFILPSHYEGVPVAALEAQANGLPMIVSNDISLEVCLLETSWRLPVEPYNAVNMWVEQLIKCRENYSRYPEKKCYEKMTDSGYNIIVESQCLREIYEK